MSSAMMMMMAAAQKSPCGELTISDELSIDGKLANVYAVVRSSLISVGGGSDSLVRGTPVKNGAWTLNDPVWDTAYSVKPNVAVGPSNLLVTSFYHCNEAKLWQLQKVTVSGGLSAQLSVNDPNGKISRVIGVSASYMAAGTGAMGRISSAAVENIALLDSRTVNRENYIDDYGGPSSPIYSRVHVTQSVTNAAGTQIRSRVRDAETHASFTWMGGYVKTSLSNAEVTNSIDWSLSQPVQNYTKRGHLEDLSAQRELDSLEESEYINFVKKSANFSYTEKGPTQNIQYSHVLAPDGLIWPNGLRETYHDVDLGLLDTKTIQREGKDPELVSVVVDSMNFPLPLNFNDRCTYAAKLAQMRMHEQDLRIKVPADPAAWNQP